MDMATKQQKGPAVSYDPSKTVLAEISISDAQTTSISVEQAKAPGGHLHLYGHRTIIGRTLNKPGSLVITMNKQARAEGTKVAKAARILELVVITPVVTDFVIMPWMTTVMVDGHAVIRMEPVVAKVGSLRCIAFTISDCVMLTQVLGVRDAVVQDWKDADDLDNCPNLKLDPHYRMEVVWYNFLIGVPRV
jgi:hypothetical protein